MFAPMTMIAQDIIQHWSHTILVSKIKHRTTL
jgi:hypothetical protein